MFNHQTKLPVRYHYGQPTIGGESWRTALQADIDRTAEVVDFLSNLPNKPAFVGPELSEHIVVLGNLKRIHGL